MKFTKVILLSKNGVKFWFTNNIKLYLKERGKYGISLDNIEFAVIRYNLCFYDWSIDKREIIHLNKNDYYIIFFWNIIDIFCCLFKRFKDSLFILNIWVIEQNLKFF